MTYTKLTTFQMYYMRMLGNYGEGMYYETPSRVLRLAPMTSRGPAIVFTYIFA